MLLLLLWLYILFSYILITRHHLIFFHFFLRWYYLYFFLVTDLLVIWQKANRLLLFLSLKMRSKYILDLLNYIHELLWWETFLSILKHVDKLLYFLNAIFEHWEFLHGISKVTLYITHFNFSQWHFMFWMKLKSTFMAH